MGVLLLVLKILGIVLASVLGAVLLALLLPVTLRLRYDSGQFSVSVRLLAVWLKLFPKKEKKAKAPAKTETLEKEEPKEKKKSKIDLEMIRGMIPPAKSFLRKLSRHIRIRGVKLVIVARGSDMAKTGIAAGRIWAAVCSGTALLNNVFRISYRKVRVIPEFSNEYEETINFDCKVTSIPVILIIAVLGFLFRYLAVKSGGEQKRNDHIHLAERKEERAG